MKFTLDWKKLAEYKYVAGKRLELDKDGERVAGTIIKVTPDSDGASFFLRNIERFDIKKVKWISDPATPSLVTQGHGQIQNVGPGRLGFNILNGFAVIYLGISLR